MAEPRRHEEIRVRNDATILLWSRSCRHMKDPSEFDMNELRIHVRARDVVREALHQHQNFTHVRREVQRISACGC